MKRFLLLAFLFASVAIAADKAKAQFVPPINVISGSSIGVPVNLQSATGSDVGAGVSVSAPGRTYVFKVQPQAFGVTTGTKIQIKLVSGGTGTLLATACPGAGANAWSCSVAPTTITWAGGSTTQATTNGVTYTSDLTTFSFNSSQPMVIAIELSNPSANDTLTYRTINYSGGVSTNTTPAVNATTTCGGASCFIAYTKNAVVEATLTTRGSGYSSSGLTDKFFGVFSITMSP